MVEGSSSVPLPEFHVVFISAAVEEGGPGRQSVRTVFGRDELEREIKNILSEYGEEAQIKVFEGRHLRVSEPKRRSMLTMTVKFDELDSTEVFVG